MTYDRDLAEIVCFLFLSAARPHRSMVGYDTMEEKAKEWNVSFVSRGDFIK